MFRASTIANGRSLQAREQLFCYCPAAGVVALHDAKGRVVNNMFSGDGVDVLAAATATLSCTLSSRAAPHERRELSRRLSSVPQCQALPRPSTKWKAVYRMRRFFSGGVTLGFSSTIVRPFGLAVGIGAADDSNQRHLGANTVQGTSRTYKKGGLGHLFNPCRHLA